LFVDSYGSARNGLTDKDLLQIIKANFNFRPGNMIKELDLKRPFYYKTAKFGAFGRNDADFTWETPKKDLKLI
jgi:S-adenosylmethionine synthetase